MMKPNTTEAISAPTTSSKASDVVHRPAAAKPFQAKVALKPDDLRAVFDDTCARYLKTLARLAE